MSLKTVVDYSSAGDFTFDAAKVEVTGGVARLKDQGPAGATLVATFTSSAAANRGAGPLAPVAFTGTLAGGATQFRGPTNQRLDFDNAGPKVGSLQGCLRARIAPNYSGTPATTQVLLQAIEADGSANNFIKTQHSTTGKLQLVYGTSAGVATVTDLGVWAPVAGTVYEIELDWKFDAPNNDSRLFVDGTQFGATVTATPVRTETLTLIRIADRHASLATFVGNFDLLDLVAFATVQHVANYVPVGAPAETTYDTAGAGIKTNSTFLADAIEAFSSQESASGGDAVTWQVEFQGQLKWWNGAAWADSDGSAAQSSAAADVAANAASLDLSAGGQVRMRAVLKSGAGATTPTVDEHEVEYSFFVEQPAAPPECVLYGWVLDLLGEPLAGEQVRVENAGFFHGKFWVKPLKRTVLTDAAGYWEMSVIESASQALAPYSVRIPGATFADVSVPNQASAALESIVP